MIVGFIGLTLLALSYLLLLGKYKKWFIPVDAVASIILTIHAIIIKDLTFIMVNGWIAIILCYKWYKRDLVVE